METYLNMNLKIKLDDLFYTYKNDNIYSIFNHKILEILLEATTDYPIRSQMLFSLFEHPIYINVSTSQNTYVSFK